MNKEKCIIWGTPLDEFSPKIHFSPQNPQGYRPYFKHLPDKNKYEIYNLRAGGQYLLSSTQMESTRADNYQTMIVLDSDGNSRDLSESEKIKLSGYIAQKNLQSTIPDLDELMEDKNRIEKLPSIPPPNERAYLLLEALIKKTYVIGKEFLIHIEEDSSHVNSENPMEEFFYSISYSDKKQEIKYLFNYLEQIKYIEKTYDNDIYLSCRVTVKGFEKITNVSNIGSKTAFIAMWIHENTDKIYKSIETSVGKAGYEPLRIDKKEHINKIDDEILSEIKKARFIICDLTSEHEKPRGSVYFEAGYALGINIPIIWTCKKGLEKGLPFDIRQYNCLVWEESKLDDFGEKLKYRIENVIGKGPLKGGDA